MPYQRVVTSVLWATESILKNKKEKISQYQSTLHMVRVRLFLEMDTCVCMHTHTHTYVLYIWKDTLVPHCGVVRKVRN